MSSERGVPLSALCPKYLHSNSTSHIWPFSAIAELIDNGYDPDVNAKQFWIDKTQIKGEDCLIFMDNGKGLNYETMKKMLSFGYSDKETVNGVHPIGIYGNGFKSGSMRLGSDAIVFSKSKDAMCVGMLSQSYLKEIKAEQIIIPIVSFNQATPNYVVEDEHEPSLQDILRYSPFKTEKDLITEILAISATPMGSTGTRIVIWNLRKTTDGTSEFDFVKDRYDIRIPTEVYYETLSEKDKQDRLTSSIPENETKFSLRAYCSILYLKPRMQIILRGQKVKTQLISKSLAYIAKDKYRPNFLSTDLRTVIVPITFGYNTKNKDHYGIMMYHKNRLIKAYERVGCQLKANNKGVGVIGVVECNFLDPTHNKQDFLNTDNYRKTMNNLGIKLEDYWKEISFKRRTEDPGSLPVEDTQKRPDQNWVQCDGCLQWRKLPDGVDSKKLPDKWFCKMNPDPQFRTCQAQEEPEDSDDEQPYEKTFRKQERANKKKQKEENEREKEELLKIKRKLNQQEKEELLKIKRKLNQQNVEVLVHAPSTPETPRTRSNIGTPCGGAASSPRCSSKLSQAACSPSTSSSLPVISGVCSLATTPSSRSKRTQPLTPARESKRPRLNNFRGSIPQTSSAEGSSPTPASMTVKDEVCIDDSDDDDVIIVYEDGIASTSVPSFDLSNVKTEPHSDTGMTSTETAAVGTGPSTETAAVGTGPSTETTAVGTGPSPPPPPDHASTTTQTQPPGVKVEDEEATRKGVEDVKKEGEMVGSEQSAPPANQQDTEEAASCPRPDLTASESPALNVYNMSDAQRQQDELMELMQATAQERDSLRDQVQQLTQQLSDMEKRLQLSKTTVNRECKASQSEPTECKDQASQSEPTEDYRSRYEQVEREVAELRRENETLLAAAQQPEDKCSDEVLSQINALKQDVERRTAERDDLNSKLVVVEEQCVNLVVQCQLLELKLEQKKADPEEGPSTEQSTAGDPGTSREAERSGGAEDSSTASGSDQTKRLVELRRNIGRLLVPLYPDVDFNQFNYQCDVIDGMFDLFLQDSGK